MEYEGFDKKSVARLFEDLSSKIRIKKIPDGSFAPLTVHVVRQADGVSVDFNLFKSNYDVSIDASEDATDELPLFVSKRLLDITP